MARGHDAERATMRALTEAGYMVASRRHVGGPGDVLAWTPHVAPTNGRKLVEVPPLLVEVKNTDWPSMKPQARRDMLMAAEDWGVEPMLCWWPPNSSLGPFWIPAEDWLPTP
jgi:hypothetical protein